MRLIDITGFCESLSDHETVSGMLIKLSKQLIIDPVHAAGGCYCVECERKNTTACPAYDAPFMRTSLRIKFCSEGQRKEADHEADRCR